MRLAPFFKKHGDLFGTVSILKGLRIAFVAGTLGLGGAERQLFYLLKTLRERGAHPRVLSLTRGEFWEGKIRALGVPVTWVGRSPHRIVRLGRIIRELCRWPVDIVQSQHFFTNLYAVAAARALGLPEIGAIRNDATHELRENRGILGKLSLRWPRTVVANSSRAVRNALMLGADEQAFFVLPNVVDTHLFQPYRGCKHGPVRLLAVGRLVREKRIDVFLSLVARLRTLCSTPVIGAVVGEGPLRSYLEQDARSLGLLPESIEFCGPVSNMETVYREFDVLVHTSEHEGMPNVVLEAMACGLAVVATNVGGIPELVEPGVTGFLVRAHDYPATLSILVELVQHPSLRAQVGAAARKYVESHHSLYTLGPRLENIYRNVLETRSALRAPK